MLMHFCTLFNSAYLSRGLALYRSLLNTTPHFHLYVFAFDDMTHQVLSALQLSHMTVISLAEFETPALLAVKQERTIGEYCWTCTSASILYCLERFQLPSVCYCDADIYFWRDPAELLAEVQTGSLLLTEHRYTPKYDRTLDAGKYCVQFMWFKNDENGLKAVKWWADACLEWCYDRMESGRFGDQKYCDDWTTRFEGVVVLQHLGGGVAPWNVQQYTIANKASLKKTQSAEQRDGTVDHPALHRGAQVSLNEAVEDPGLNYQAKVVPLLEERSTGKQFDLVFYHFHALRFVNQKIDLGNYQLSSSDIEFIYKPYIKTLLAVESDLAQAPKVTNWIKSVNLHGRVERPMTLGGRLKRLKHTLLGQYHSIPLRDQ